MYVKDAGMKDTHSATHGAHMSDHHVYLLYKFKKVYNF